MTGVKNAYLNADEFLDAIAGETIDHEIVVNGRVVGKVQIRSLELREVQNALTKYNNDAGGLMLWTLDNALVTPELTEAQRETVRKGKPGALLNLARHIMTISGMVEGDGGSPLDGAGSSSAQTTEPQT